MDVDRSRPHLRVAAPDDGVVVPAAFARGWPTACAALTTVDAPSLVVVAVGDGQVLAPALVITAERDQPQIATVGRHRACALPLPTEASLARRHLAIVVEPRGGGREVRARVLDLDTADGLLAEDGEPGRSLSLDGPTLVRAGGVTLVLVPTTGDDAWPIEPAAAWARLPPRRVLDAVDDEPAALPRRLAHGTDAPATEAAPRVTTVRLGPAPLRREIGAPASGPAGRLRGRLAIAGAPAILVDDAAATAGVLVGRGSGHALPALATAGISRLHLLLLELGGRLWAFDVGSSHGTRRPGGARAPSFALADGDELVLGEGLARVRWAAAR
ncbi:MAG: hypothetical protein R2939_07870 [Kofleriaceae bacterium]